MAEETMNRNFNCRIERDLRPSLRRDRLFSTILFAAGCLALHAGIVVPVRAELRLGVPAETSTNTSEGDEVQTVLARLKHTSAARRCEALLRLPDLHVEPEAALLRIWPLLHDADPSVRIQAARAVWLIGQRADAAVATLNGMLDPENPQVCALASFLAGEIGTGAREALPALRARMTESDPLLRLHGAEAIAKIDPTDSAAHATLIRALHEQSADVRYFAACALLTAGDRYRDQVRSALLVALSDDDLRVASAAALSLENRPHARSTRGAEFDRTGSLVPAPELSRLMSNLTDSSPAVRRQAALRLADLEESAAPAVRTLRQRLGDDDPLVRAYVAYALWEVNHQSAAVVPTLIDLLGTIRPNVTTLATSVLARIGPDAADALPALYDLLESSDALVRMHIAIAISRIDPRGREAVGILTAAAHDRDSDLRYLATLSLGHVSLLSRKRAERELNVALGDRNLRVRAAAAMALDSLRTAAAQARLQDDAAATSVEQVADDSAGAGRREEVAAYDEVPPDTATIPTLDERLEAETRPSPRVRDGAYDIDEQTVEERKTIGELRARITPSEGDFPIDHAGPHFADQPIVHHGYGTVRGWNGLSYAWNNTGVCHAPLYFQDLNLERYGYHYGCAQTFVSSVKFVADTALFTYKLVAEPPCDCVYTLGYDRPGNCVPYRCYRLPWRTDAAMVLTGVGVGLFFLAP
jgi:hypothetical protein